MNALRAWFARLAGVWTGRRHDRELAAELEAHLEMHLDDNLRAGMSAEDARRGALSKLGGVLQTRERVRDRRGFPLVDTLAQDLRYAARTWRKNPMFALVAALTLALGIGANTAIFSIVNATMIRPLPYPDSNRLVRIFHAYPKLNMPGRVTVSPAYFAYYREHARSFASIAAATLYRTPQNLTGQGDPERVQTCATTWNLFELLGARPLLGQTFHAPEDQPGHNRVVVLGYGLWNRRFGANPEIIGRPITLDGADYTVIGVMPRGFAYPAEAELWVPIAFTPQEQNSGDDFLDVVGKLRVGVSEAQANAELATISRNLVDLNGGDNRAGWYVYATPMREAAVGDMRTAVLVLLAAVACVLLIACVNVTNLFLARASARHKEIAIRGALGASRWRVCRQLITEGLMLSMLGGACGLALGYWGLDVLLKMMPIKMPAFIHIQVDPAVMLFTFALTLVTGLLFSAAPAWQLSNSRLNDSLLEGGRTPTSGGRHALRSGLVVAEVAISLVLLIGAGLLIKSFVRILESNPGFNPSRVLTMEIALPETKYQAQKQTAFFSQVLARVSTLPNVTSAAVAIKLPMQGTGWTSTFSIQGWQFPVSPHAQVSTISGTYFETMQIPIISGRPFSATDDETSLPVAIIDANAAHAYFPGEIAIGKRVMFTFEGTPQKRIWRAIVGVVGSVKYDSPIETETRGQVFIPYLQLPVPYMSLAVRTRNEPGAAATAVRRQIQAVDAGQPVQHVKTMEEVLNEFVSEPRFNMRLLAAFAGLALVLSAIGVYGVMAYSVTQRTHEIGVRMALGAQRADVLTLVLSQTFRLAAIGVAIGLFGALLATRALATLLFEVTPTDPATFIEFSGLLALVAVAASYVPALRATRVDPNVALRCE